MDSSLTTEQIYETLQRSGYLMEQRVCPLIEKHGYFVTPNHQYQDQDTGKSREIDIHALAVTSLYRQDYDDMFTSTSLVSYKNNHLPVIAFTHLNYVRGVPAISIPKAGHPLEVEQSRSTEDVEWFLRFGDYHHYYLAQYISSQYCRIEERRVGKTTEYIADHGDLYNDLDSLVKAANAEMARYKVVSLEQAKALRQRDRESDINFVIIHPIMVFSGELYECRQNKRKVESRPVNHNVFVRRVESRALEGEFFVDFIRESYLNRYLASIGKECEEIEKRLRRHRKLLRRSVVKQLRQLTSQPTSSTNDSTEPRR